MATPAPVAPPTGPFLERYRLDPWTPLSHKQVIGDGLYQPPTALAPGWVDALNRRRLNAYKVLQGYQDNASRHFLAVQDIETRNEQREYGDAALIVATVRASLLGDAQQITVDGASDFDPELGKDEAQPDEPPSGLLGPSGEPLPPTSTGPTPEELAANEEAQVLAEREDWLHEWATDERFAIKMMDAERKAIGLGDAVFRLSWSSAKARPKLQVYDPGFYFPVFDDRTDDEEFPHRVHLAWEIVEDDKGTQTVAQANLPVATVAPATRKVRRITYELVQLPEGIKRSYPWQPDDEPPSKVTCLMTDAIWTLPANGVPGPDDFSMANAEYQQNEDGDPIKQLDLAIDFIPLVHLPNTVAGADHFGRSVLSPILQLLDDLQNADTDLAAASGLTGTPPIWVSGLTASTQSIDTYGPGSVWNLGPEGKAGAIDTSAALEALMHLIEFLLQRTSTNSRTTEAVLGRIKGQIPSGVALALLFGPLQSLIGEMRLIREEKYPLLLKFVQRMAQVGRTAKGAPALEPGPVPDTSLDFGAFMPVDRAALVAEVTQLLAAHAISLQTAVSMLIEGGFSIEDAAEEVERIRQEDFAAADAMLQATGDEQAVRERLGLPGLGPRPTQAQLPALAFPGGPQPGGPQPTNAPGPPGPGGPEPAPTARPQPPGPQAGR